MSIDRFKEFIVFMILFYSNILHFIFGNKVVDFLLIQTNLITNHLEEIKLSLKNFTNLGIFLFTTPFRLIKHLNKTLELIFNFFKKCYTIILHKLTNYHIVIICENIKEHFLNNWNSVDNFKDRLKLLSGYSIKILLNVFLPLADFVTDVCFVVKLISDDHYDIWFTIASGTYLNKVFTI